MLLTIVFVVVIGYLALGLLHFVMVGVTELVSDHEGFFYLVVWMAFVFGSVCGLYYLFS